MAFDIHLQKVMAELLPGGEYPRPDPTGLKDYLKWDDWRVQGMIAEGQGGEHANRMLTRRHYRLIYSSRDRLIRPKEKRRGLNVVLQESKKLQSVKVALGDLLAAEKTSNNSWYKTVEGSDIPIIDDADAALIEPLSYYSAMAELNAEDQNLLYVAPEDVATAKKLVADAVADFERQNVADSQKNSKPKKLRKKKTPKKPPVSHRPSERALNQRKSKFPERRKKMLSDPITTNRLAVFAELVDESNFRIGRTAFMKLCYFLQTLKGMQLGYEFTLYSYGPFDSEVLADLRQAEDLSVLESSVTSFSGGYQYQFSTSENAPLVKRSGRKFLQENARSITWVVETFASKTASELELLSTIVYVDRDKRFTAQNLLRDKVRQIKPHFPLPTIDSRIDWLRSQHLLENLK